MATTLSNSTNIGFAEDRSHLQSIAGFISRTIALYVDTGLKYRLSDNLPNRPTKVIVAKRGTR